MYFVYCLVKKGVPFYIGMTSNIHNRELSHRRTKDFDYLFVIKKYKSKKDALIAENSLLRFMSIIDIGVKFNGRFENLMWEKITFDSIHENNGRPSKLHKTP